ncbi:hypothetical protein BFL38_09260 [Brachyspira hampsonii]|uniref:Uncharacterized protein n=1 Tax=Brachyspira hampsonii TaxID=1287055 RepID=A0A1E5NHK8_9SPIR|nr:hypothetical protein [Brachyspira hampsonii]OEJ15650.1 hypothetical protein BFL38_09260 [Brachyspira hampsonii]
MTSFTLENVTKKILENSDFSKTSAIEIANFIAEDDCFMLEEDFFRRVYYKEKKELIIDINMQAILNVFKEFNTKQFADFVKNKKNKFDKNKIMAKGHNYILYRM